MRTPEHQPKGEQGDLKYQTTVKFALKAYEGVMNA
jgi:hypothetical protein